MLRDATFKVSGYHWLCFELLSLSLLLWSSGRLPLASVFNCQASRPKQVKGCVSPGIYNNLRSDGIQKQNKASLRQCKSLKLLGPSLDFNSTTGLQGAQLIANQHQQLQLLTLMRLTQNSPPD
ncbi:hypothetical protein COCON_G00156070 [Conger conger]|uniref:Uncharacterized protein n=1 Tax=Conger conger TaxID=82655 RepID=A0A9Q1D9S7_CONCO|nr:hypothetical protein COCON_G00156070 [Conger conger]